MLFAFASGRWRLRPQWRRVHVYKTVGYRNNGPTRWNCSATTDRKSEEKPALNLIRTEDGPMFDRMDHLRLEEALLRTPSLKDHGIDVNSSNWCILGRGRSPPKIVMGISGKPRELLNVDEVYKNGIEVIRRFSGGGTVIVDHNTLFVTLILNQSSVAGAPRYPNEVMKWSEQFYSPIFRKVAPSSEAFCLNEQDYCLGQVKMGGNAQSMSRDRFVHHTSFLWDFDEENMDLLALPSKQPAYREHRSHKDFLTPLKHHISSSGAFFAAVEEQARTCFTVTNLSLEQVSPLLDSYAGRQSNRHVDMAEYIDQ